MISTEHYLVSILFKVVNIMDEALVGKYVLRDKSVQSVAIC